MLANIRTNYDVGGLERSDLPADPFILFNKWLDAAFAKQSTHEPHAMTLATATPDGIPSARMVLLKGVDHGFRFYTNYTSHKANELADNPNAALVFYWGHLHRQVRIVGMVEKVTEAESAEYFHSRPRASQIGAWSSPQSTVLPNRATLEALNKKITAQYDGIDPLPLPPHWGGYRLIPTTIEFWQGRPSRLHDRFRYIRLNDDEWQIDRLAP